MATVTHAHFTLSLQMSQGVVKALYTLTTLLLLNKPPCKKIRVVVVNHHNCVSSVHVARLRRELINRSSRKRRVYLTSKMKGVGWVSEKRWTQIRTWTRTRKQVH